MKKFDNLTPFSLFGITLVIFGWLAFFLAVFGLFRVWIILALASVLFLVFCYSLFLWQKEARLSHDFILVIILSLLAVLIFSHFTTPTIFTGRDQGSLSSAAISLAQNHSLKTSFPAEKEFFKIYGTGTALNFPGSYYTKNGELVSQFPLGYTTYLAAFYAIFGLGGLIVANAFSFFLFLLSFYAIANKYLETKASLIAFGLIITSFVFSWFFKFTLSENLALGLLWFGIAQFLLFWEKENQKNLLFFLLTFGLLLFVRIETIAFLAVIGVMFFLRYRHRTPQFKEIFFHWKILSLATFILLALLFSFYASSAFYITLAKGFLNSFSFYDKTDPSGTTFPFAGTFYVLRVLTTYALLTYIILGLAALFYFLKKKDFGKLIPYFILLPAFIYLLHPSVSLDHPWMLRRFVFAIIPACILYSIIFLNDLLKKNKIFYVFSFFLLLTNLLIFYPLLSVQENPTLLPQISSLSQNFQANDLILVDRNATGNPWSMMTGPLNLIFKKQAVYFFNPADLEKIDLTKFDKVYFIIPDNNLNFYAQSGLLDRMITVKSYSLENLALNETDLARKEIYQSPVIVPPYLKNYIYGKIYLLRQP